LIKRKNASSIIVLILVAESVYAAFFSSIAYILFSSVNMVMEVMLALLATTFGSPDEAVLISLVYLSTSSLLALYASQTTFSVGLTALNLFLAWQVATSWRHIYYALLAQSVMVIAISLFIMPEAAGAFLIVTSFLLLIASQSREVKISRGGKVKDGRRE